VWNWICGKYLWRNLISNETLCQMIIVLWSKKGVICDSKVCICGAVFSLSKDNHVINATICLSSEIFLFGLSRDLNWFMIFQFGSISTIAIWIASSWTVSRPVVSKSIPTYLYCGWSCIGWFFLVKKCFLLL